MGIRNAKQEFIEEVGNKEVKCAYLYTYKEDSFEDEHRLFNILKIGYSSDDYIKFLNSLDFTYYARFGRQKLYGFIWYNDGTWSERHEYGGPECWVHPRVPTIPEDCKEMTHE